MLAMRNWSLRACQFSGDRPICLTGATAPCSFAILRTTSSKSMLNTDPRCAALVLLALLLGAALTTEAAPPSNVAYRRIDLQDAATGELFPGALWYPTRAAPAPLFLTDS